MSNTLLLLSFRSDYYGQAIRGFFRAPRTGNYRFYIASDDSSQLWISNTPESLDRTKLVLLASVGSYTSFRNYIANIASQISAPVAMQEGRYYLLEAYHVEGVGDDHLSVAVEVPSDCEEPNSINEISQVTITYSPVLEVVDLRLWGATGGVWKITIGERTTRELNWGDTAAAVENVILLLGKFVFINFFFFL